MDCTLKSFHENYLNEFAVEMLVIKGIPRKYRETGFLAISESAPDIAFLFAFSQFLHLK